MFLIAFLVLKSSEVAQNIWFNQYFNPLWIWNSNSLHIANWDSQQHHYLWNKFHARFNKDRHIREWKLPFLQQSAAF